MLIETSFKKDDIITMKLVSGEEIVARLKEETNDLTTVTKPMAAMMSEKGLVLLPYIMTVNSENEIKFQKSSIIFIAKSLKEIADHYLQTTTGITLGV